MSGDQVSPGDKSSTTHRNRDELEREIRDCNVDGI
jgi:hypothetical protein